MKHLWYWYKCQYCGLIFICQGTCYNSDKMERIKRHSCRCNRCHKAHNGTIECDEREATSKEIVAYNL